jgi:hypothetical protein
MFSATPTTMNMESSNSDTNANLHLPEEDVTANPLMIPLKNPDTPNPGSFAMPGNEMNYTMIEELLEIEKQRNKSEAWNKIDKTQKTVKLHAFAEKYGKEHGLPMKEIRHLKAFFSDCLDRAKLQKTKDVVYNKDTREITSIPALHFNATTQAFTLKMLDTNRRVSTLKSLTPKRITEKNQESDKA